VDDAQDNPLTDAERDASFIQLTLFAVEKHVSKERRDGYSLPIGFEVPFMGLYESGVVFTQVPEASLNEVETEVSRLRVLINNERQLTTVAGFQQQDRTHGTGVNSTGTTSDTSPTSAGEAESVIGTRRVIRWLIADLRVKIDLLLSTAKDLVDQFVPQYYDHVLLRRYWGSIDAIYKVRLCAVFEATVPRSLIDA
jgi:hypothetical protein